MGIVDTFEAMTTTQFYRQTPFSVEEAAKTIREGFGRLFDPSLAEAFDKALPVMKKVRETYSDALGDLINLDFSPTRDAPAKPAPKAAPAMPAAPKPSPAKAGAPKPAASKAGEAAGTRTPPKR
jgi:hypothetical protein